MKNLCKNLGVLSVLTASVIATTASADNYDLTFTAASPDGTIADGQIDVVNGAAINGSLDIMTGPAAGDYTLAPGAGDDGIFIYDNLVSPGQDGIVDESGLLWSLSGAAGNSPEVNLWFNSVAEYGAPADTYSLWSTAGNLESFGSVALTASPNLVSSGIGSGIGASAIPDGGSTCALLIGGLGCIIALRRQVRC